MRGRSVVTIAVFWILFLSLDSFISAQTADLETLRNSAEQGDASAQAQIGYRYEIGQGVPQDYAEALKWYQKAAAQGNAYGEYDLGVLYDHGHGVPQDYAEALKWYQQAADQGNALGEHGLGVLYDNGHGVPQDYTQAVKWYQKAADQGLADAEHNLGVLYESGHGVTQDYAQALKWYQKAADQGFANAEYAIGFMREFGQGVPKDDAEALKWYQKAADGGEVDAKAAIERVNARIQQASAAIPPAASNEQRIALVIGNSHYLNVAQLNNPANDAQSVAAVLQNDGFRLVDDKVFVDLDRTAFEQALQQFGDQIQAETAKGPTVAFFYYAGHGLEVKGVNYLVPTAADPHKESDVSLQAVPLDAVFEQMDSGDAKLKIVVLDACRNNPFADRGLRAIEGGLAQVNAPDGTLIAYATRPGTTAQDGSGAHSPYSQALTEALGEQGRGLFDVFNDTAVQVMHRTNRAQIPWTDESAIEGSFYFIHPSS